MVHRLLVNFSLSKTMAPWEFHRSPRAGESPWRKSPEVGKGSPAPATVHFELKQVDFLVAYICYNNHFLLLITCGRRSGIFCRQMVPVEVPLRRPLLALGLKLAP